MGDQSHTSQKTMLDEKVLSELKDIMDDEFNEVLESYLDESLSLLAELHESEKQNDNEMFIHAAHSLKSSSANVGSTVVSLLAERMESLARSNKMGEARDLIAELDTRYQETRKEIEKFKQIITAD